jgi:hypothetical protein
LLNAATELGHFECISHLCALPPAVGLGTEQVTQLLLAAVNDGNSSCVKQLCLLPAASELDSKQIA